ncbi:uncharacterized protein LOC128963384 [Oppia nitens]|uniref:uncharacterized protein LOC128963384 n=1 Tax=Oppia nitens TaxID=1686743 RepID=UPI0023DB7EA7|nr:uncharacterized protein LOC128963384 [Oppia nitens]
MGQYTSDTKTSNRTFNVTKYVLILFIVLNIGSSIWVGIYNKMRVDHMRREFPDDRWTGDYGKGHSAQLWEKLCITFLVFENIFNVMGIVGTLQENYCLSIMFSGVMFLSALYGSAGKFIRGSVCSYLMPLLVGIIAAVYAHQIRMQNYRLNNRLTSTRTTEPKSPTLLPQVNPEAIYSVPNKSAKQPKPSSRTSSSRTPPPPTKPKPSPPSNPLISNNNNRSFERKYSQHSGNGEERIYMNGSVINNHNTRVYVPTTEV